MAMGTWVVGSVGAVVPVVGDHHRDQRPGGQRDGQPGEEPVGRLVAPRRQHVEAGEAQGPAGREGEGEEEPEEAHRGERPLVDEQRGGRPERDHVGEAVELHPEVGLGARHPGHPAVEHVEEDGEEDGQRRPVELLGRGVPGGQGHGVEPEEDRADREQVRQHEHGLAQVDLHRGAILLEASGDVSGWHAGQGLSRREPLHVLLSHPNGCGNDTVHDRIAPATRRAASRTSSRVTSRWVMKRTRSGREPSGGEDARGRSGRPGRRHPARRRRRRPGWSPPGGDHHPREARELRRQRPGVLVVLGEPGHVVLERVEAGRGQDAGLAHAAAEPLAEPPRLGDDPSRSPASTEPTGAPSPLREADRDQSVTPRREVAAPGRPTATTAFKSRAPSR